MSQSSNYLLIQLAMSQAEYAVALTIGESVQYSSRSSAPVTIQVTALLQKDEMSTILETRSQTTEIDFIAPMQPSQNAPIFPPPYGITVTDTITRSDGSVYRIDSWSDLQTNGGVFKLHCIRTKTKQIGAIGT